MERKCLLAIRIRGGVNASVRVKDTLRMLRMGRNNAATLLDNRPDNLGMLQKAKDRITWGEPTVETIRLLLESRGEVPGGDRIDPETLKSLGYDSIDALAADLHACEVRLTELEGVKPFFRLHPPSGGFRRTVKRPYRADGELGYRGDAINDLARRMC